MRLNLDEIQKALLRGELRMVDIAESCLEVARSYSSHNAYTEIYTDELLEKAAQLDRRIANDRENLGMLFGAVVSLKDNICFEGHGVSAGSRMLENYISPYSATVVKRMLDQDALVLGRTNCDEFSMGSSGTRSFHGIVRNAVDPSRIAGGSSSGAAVANTLGSCLVSVGSDTGGSIRQPAAYNGSIGYKPSYGMLSRWGLIAYGSSLDQLGLVAQSTSDISRIMACVSGADDYDSTVVSFDPGRFEKTNQAGSARIGVLRNFFTKDWLTEECLSASLDYLENLKSRGYHIDDVTIDFTELLVPCYYILCTAEASSNLARYDGIRYGYTSANEGIDYRDWIRNTRTEAFGKEVKKRIILGNYVLSQGYKEAYFQKAVDIRKEIKAKMDAIFKSYDYIVLPVTTGVAWGIDSGPEDPMDIYNGDVFTVIANLVGLPSISLPIKNKSSKMPLGIQIMARRLEDPSLLAFAGKLGF